MRIRTGSSKRHALGVLLAVALVASACGAKEDPLQIVLKRVALDLAFKDAAKAPPIPPRKIITQFVPADQIIYIDEQIPPEVKKDLPKVLPAAPKVVKPCPAADPNGTPKVPAFAVVKNPPTTGVFTRHNKGTIKIDNAILPLTIPYPSTSAWEVRNVEQVNASTYLQPADRDAIEPQQVRDDTTANPPKTRFQVFKSLGRTSSILDTYQYSVGATGGDYLWLLERVTVFQGTKETFRPTPPIRVMDLNKPEGETENHGGTDRDSGVAMTIQSAIGPREWIDVCGEWFDTYKVSFRETMVDLNKNPPETSGNEGGDPACAPHEDGVPDQPCNQQVNSWNIQFDNGLLVLKEEGHYARHTSIAGPGGSSLPVTLRYDYSSVVDSINPDPNAKVSS